MIKFRRIDACYADLGAVYNNRIAIYDVAAAFDNGVWCCWLWLVTGRWPWTGPKTGINSPDRCRGRNPARPFAVEKQPFEYPNEHLDLQSVEERNAVSKFQIEII